MPAIEKQWLLFDRTDICTGTTHYYFDENRVTEEGRKKGEELYNFWNFCMEIGPRHAMTTLRVPFGVRFVAEKAHVTRPLFPLDKPWESEKQGRLGYISACFDEQDKLYKIWYPIGKHSFLAVSEDLKTWTKPELDVWEFEGKKTNAISINVAEGSIFLDDLHPETGRFKAVDLIETEGSTPIERVALTMFASDDGVHFSQMDIQPLHYFFDTQNEIFYDEELGKYVGYLRGHYNGRAIQRTEADDLKNIPMPSIMMFSDNEDPLDADYYNNCCTLYPYDKHYRIMLPSIYCHGADNVFVRMAHSRNGRQFQWTTRESVIDGVDEDGAVLNNYYACPHMFKLDYDGKPCVGVAMRAVGNLHNEGYYGTLYGEHNEFNRGIRMAVWEKDRLAGLYADECGEFYLQMRLKDYQSIQINAKMRGQGALSYELVTQREDLPLPGFGMKECVPMCGDAVWQTAKWQGDPALPETIGERDVFLHLRVDHGTVYGIRIINDPEHSGDEAGENTERIVSALLSNRK